MRTYLTALIDGDERTAYEQLGVSPGDPSASLDEERFLDHSARITDIRVRSTGARSVTVDADVATSRGTFFTTFDVAEDSGGAAIIKTHESIQP